MCSCIACTPDSAASKPAENCRTPGLAERTEAREAAGLRE
jgi:hypothetical protein